MAAGQQKRRLNAASVVSTSLQEKYGPRKKNLEPTENLLKINSHIFLKWDENQVNPIARRGQVGIAWRDYPFIVSAPHHFTPLADVLSLPQEIFELENHKCCRMSILENLLKLKERWITSKDPEKHIVQNAWRDRCGDSLGVTETTLIRETSEEEERKKSHIQSIDVSKYMPYFKISRKQHQLIKRMKQCGNGIQSKSLDHVLGNIKSLCVQSYETFEKEEELHDFWSSLANRDLPAAYLDRRVKQLKQQKWRCSLEQELGGKEKHLLEEEEEKNCCDSMVDKQIRKKLNMKLLWIYIVMKMMSLFLNQLTISMWNKSPHLMVTSLIPWRKILMTAVENFEN